MNRNYIKPAIFALCHDTYFNEYTILRKNNVTHVFFSITSMLIKRPTKSKTPLQVEKTYKQGKNHIALVQFKQFIKTFQNDER